MSKQARVACPHCGHLFTVRQVEQRGFIRRWWGRMFPGEPLIHVSRPMTESEKKELDAAFGSVQKSFDDVGNVFRKMFRHDRVR